MTKKLMIRKTTKSTKDYREKQKQLTEYKLCKVNSKVSVNSLEEDIDIDNNNSCNVVWYNI